MSGTITRGKMVRGDGARWDGVNLTYSRKDASGGTVTGMAVDNEVDVAQVFGSGTAFTSSSISRAVSYIGSRFATLLLAPTTWTIDANVTIPSNICVRIPAGALLDIDSGITLTINGNVYSDLSSDDFTSGSGTLSLLGGGVVGGISSSAIRTAEEIAAGVTPVNYDYEPGNILRYGTNTTPGTTDMTTALQNACTVSKDIYIPAGVYAISSSITFGSTAAVNLSNVRFHGVSQGGASMVGTVFVWTGAADGVPLKTTGVRDSIFENFVVTVGASPSTVHTAIDIDSTSRPQVETNNIFRGIGIVQRGGATTADGSLKYGFRIGRVGSSGNSDLCTFENVQIFGCSVAGISIEHSQSRAHHFTKSAIVFCAVGITNKLNSSSGGDIMVFNGNFGANGIDMDMAGTGNSHIFGMLSEESERVLNWTGSNNAVPINIQGVFATSNTVPVDGEIFRFGYTAVSGCSGPINISGCSFSTSNVDTKIAFNQAAGVINVTGCSFYGAGSAIYVPFVNSGGTTRVNSVGNRIWNGASYVHLPQVFTEFGNGDTTPDVSSGDLYTTANTNPTTITTFDNGYAGQVIRIVFTEANTTIAESGNIKLSAAFTSTADDTMTLLYNGTSWFETARSVN